jgi:hypothetical protein
MEITSVPSPACCPDIEAILSKFTSTSGYTIHFAGNGELFYSIKNNSGSNWGDCYVLPNSYIVNAPMLVVFTNDNDSLRAYINGVKIYQSEIPTGTSIGENNVTMYFGKEVLVNNYFKGSLDDIGIWNRALTQQEITQLYNADNTCQSLVINTGILTFNPPTYNNTVTIYPNPTNDQITIDCGNLTNVSGWAIKIVNALGQEVFSAAMNTQQYIVPLNTWTGQGVYFVKIYDASNNLMNTKQIILQ